MEHVSGGLDPLAALDAEYAAVVAQTRSAVPAPASAAPEEAHGDSGDSASDDESIGFAADNYALLPSSPCPSDGGQEAFPQEQHEASGKAAVHAAETEKGTREEEQGHTEQPAEMAAATRRTIMQSMQQMKLRPPPWAQTAELSDAELLGLVQQQLGLEPRASESGRAPSSSRQDTSVPM